MTGYYDTCREAFQVVVQCVGMFFSVLSDPNIHTGSHLFIVSRRQCYEKPGHRVSYRL